MERLKQRFVKDGAKLSHSDPASTGQPCLPSGSEALGSEDHAGFSCQILYQVRHSSLANCSSLLFALLLLWLVWGLLSGLTSPPTLHVPSYIKSPSPVLPKYHARPSHGSNLLNYSNLFEWLPFPLEVSSLWADCINHLRISRVQHDGSSR